MQRIRDKLDEFLGYTLSDDQWEAFEELGLVADYESGMDFEDLADLVKRLTGGSSPRGTAAPRMAKYKKERALDRTFALAEVVAALANDDSGVRAFRSSVLDDQLLPWSELDSWISRTLSEESGPTQFITVPLPPGTEIQRGPGGAEVAKPPIDGFRYGVERTTPTLSYARPGDTWVRVVTPTIGGKLDRLRRLAKSLRLYGWSEAQGVIFTVCGIPPLIEPISVTQQGITMRDGTLVTWGPQITLKVDPTVSPAKVEEAYRQERDSMGMKNYRDMERKHLQLAVFITKSAEREPWRARLSRWNSEYPDWKYGHESNFRRDARNAQLRLLEPGSHHGRSRLSHLVSSRAQRSA